MKKFVVITVMALLCATLAFGTAWADEIKDQIKDALTFYEKGKISKAISELEFALAQLRQKKADALGGVFPDAPSGWTAQKPQSQSAGQAMMGGGITASRTYTKGRGSAKIEIITDSPMLQSMAMMLTNPMFLQGGRNGKLVRFKGEKAILKNEGPKGASLQCVLDNKVLFKVSVHRVDDPQGLAKKFARMVDLDKVRELAK